MSRTLRGTGSGFVVLVVLMVCAASARASTITVFSDVNVFGSTLPPDNDQLALNMLGSSTNVLISTQIPGVSTADGLNTYYNSLFGVTNTRTSATLTGALLAGIDLLVLDIDFSGPNPYDASEQSVIASFLAGSGDVAVIAESDAAADIAGYNALLSGIGSSISYEGPARVSPGLQTADTILSTPLTAGVSTITVGGINNLLGGTPAIQDDGFTAVAFESTTPIPEPGTWLLFGIGAVGLVGWRRRRRAA